MTSKLAIKPSRKDRPRSSERAGASKLARKSKDAGTPDIKGMSPVALAGQNGTDAHPNSPLIAASLIDGEMKLLRINPEELKSAVMPTPPKTEKNTNKVFVRKKVPVSSIPKEKKSIIVAKRAPPDASIKIPNPEDYPGLRLDRSGAIIPHSILGPVDQFMDTARVKGDNQVHSLPYPSKSSPSPWPEKENKDLSLGVNRTRQPHVNETRALSNWNKQMENRKREQRYLSETMGVPADMLLMNQDEDFRAKQEQRTLIDRAIPAMDYGKGYRSGSEFWKQVENIGGDYGINMTLTQTERGYAPPVEYIGKPDRTRMNMGTDWYETRRMAHIHYPWLKSQYLNQRKEQLTSVINELMPHDPYVDELEVVGRKLDVRHEEDSQDHLEVNNNKQQEVISASNEPTEYEGELGDPLANYDDVVPLPIFGPSLTINGYSASWNGPPTETVNEAALDLRLQFESPAGENASNSIDITNDGTSAVYFSWRKSEKKDPFGIKKVRPLQRFYFDIRNGVILPNDSLQIQFSFKSPNAGIFSEHWQLDTQPLLCKGAPINVLLRGIATQEDETADQRKELEDELQRKVTQTTIDKIVEEILNGVRTPPRPSTPIDSYITEEEMFARKNEKMNFNSEAICDLKDIHEQLSEAQEWDMSMETLMKATRNAEDEEVEESLIQKVNADVALLAFPTECPVKKPLYDKCYQLLCGAIDDFYSKASILGPSLGLPSKEFVVEVQLEEVSKKGKKAPTQDSGKGLADKKQDPKKKQDSRPTSSMRGKTPANQKTKSKETVGPTSVTPKQTVVEHHVEKKPFKKLAIDTKIEHPMAERYYEGLYIQMYDVLHDLVGKMEETVFSQNLDDTTL